LLMRFLLTSCRWDLVEKTAWHVDDFEIRPVLVLRTVVWTCLLGLYPPFCGMKTARQIFDGVSLSVSVYTWISINLFLSVWLSSSVRLWISLSFYKRVLFRTNNKNNTVLYVQPITIFLWLSFSVYKYLHTSISSSVSACLRLSLAKILYI
jgi:hypothetical protein